MPRSRKIASPINEPYVAGLGESSEDEEGKEGENVKDDAVLNRF